MWNSRAHARVYFGIMKFLVVYMLVLLIGCAAGHLANIIAAHVRTLHERRRRRLPAARALRKPAGFKQLRF